MGTWGAGNLDNDTALDDLTDRSQALIDQLMSRMRSKQSHEADEWVHSALFVDFEVVFAFNAKRLLLGCTLPSAAEVRALRNAFIANWSLYFDKLGSSAEFKAKREDVIRRTFNRFAALCAKHAD